jgi:hypothetical protein
MVASGTADMARVDLRRNGIGDGSHAYEVDLPEDFAAASGSLTVVAVSPATGEEVVLQAPSQDERAAEAAISAPLNKVLDRLELLIEAQRRSQILQREAAETLRKTANSIEEITSQDNGIASALADFDRRIEDLTNAADRPMKRAVALLIAFGGTSAVCAIATLIFLLRPWSA